MGPQGSVTTVLGALRSSRLARGAGSGSSATLAQGSFGKAMRARFLVSPVGGRRAFLRAGFWAFLTRFAMTFPLRAPDLLAFPSFLSGGGNDRFFPCCDSEPRDRKPTGLVDPRNFRLDGCWDCHCVASAGCRVFLRQREGIKRELDWGKKVGPGRVDGRGWPSELELSAVYFLRPAIPRGPSRTWGTSLGRNLG